jgi:two-component system, response regulator, stage 0 sporulation protein A
MANKTSFSFELGILHEEIRNLRSEVFALKEKVNGQSTKSEEEEVIPASPSPTNDLETIIFNFLLTYQVAVHIKGFRYLQEAIKMEITSMALSDGITKVVYPVIAHKYNDTPTRVERAIRHAIETAWYRSKHPDLVQRMIEKPTNSEFIALAAQKIRLAEGNIA